MNKARRNSEESGQPVVVAVVNTNPDLVRLFRVALEQAGFIVVVFHIEEIKRGADIATMLRQHDPRVVVYDVAPPYEQNWRFLDHLRSATDFRGRHFVLTTVNAERLHRVIGNDASVYEVAGEPDDMEQLVRAVKEASRARPTK